jgi:hypothetical protein
VASQPVAPHLLPISTMADPNDEEHVSRKVIVEHSANTGSSWNPGWTIGVIVVIAIALIIYIVMHMRH